LTECAQCLAHPLIAPQTHAQTTTTGHVMGEQAQQTKHKGESLLEKAAHAVGINK
jgi:hypothetical protein